MSEVAQGLCLCSAVLGNVAIAPRQLLPWGRLALCSVLDVCTLKKFQCPFHLLPIPRGKSRGGGRCHSRTEGGSGCASQFEAAKVQDSSVCQMGEGALPCCLHPGAVWLPSSTAPRQGKTGGFQSIKSTLGVSLRPQHCSDTQSFCSIQGWLLHLLPPKVSQRAEEMQKEALDMKSPGTHSRGCFRVLCV